MIDAEKVMLQKVEARRVLAPVVNGLITSVGIKATLCVLSDICAETARLAKCPSKRWFKRFMAKAWDYTKDEV